MRLLNVTKLHGEFYGKPIMSGKRKMIVIIPLEFHDNLQPVLHRMLKFSWEEIIEHEESKHTPNGNKKK